MRPTHRTSFATTVPRGDLEVPLFVSYVTARNESAGQDYPEDVEVMDAAGKPFEVTPAEFMHLADEAADHCNDPTFYDGPEGSDE